MGSFSMQTEIRRATLFNLFYCIRIENESQRYVISWYSTGEIGRIGRHRAETRRYFNIRFFGPIPPDASDFPGGIPAIARNLYV